MSVKESEDSEPFEEALDEDRDPSDDEELMDSVEADLGSML
jgi:hypothetical protein